MKRKFSFGWPTKRRQLPEGRLRYRDSEILIHLIHHSWCHHFVLPTLEIKQFSCFCFVATTALRCSRLSSRWDQKIAEASTMTMFKFRSRLFVGVLASPRRRRMRCNNNKLTTETATTVTASFGLDGASPETNPSIQQSLDISAGKYSLFFDSHGCIILVLTSMTSALEISRLRLLPKHRHPSVGQDARIQRQWNLFSGSIFNNMHNVQHGSLVPGNEVERR